MKDAVQRYLHWLTIYPWGGWGPRRPDAADVLVSRCQVVGKKIAAGLRL